MKKQVGNSGPNPSIPVDPVMAMPDLSDLTLDPGTGKGAMLHNNLATSTAQVRVGNAKLKSDYLATPWGNFVLRMTSGQKLSPDMQVPPKPPMALELSPPNADGLVFPQVGTTPVCDVPTLPVYTGGLASLTPSTAPPGVFMGIGHSAGGKYYDANYGDTIPGEQRAPPQADGHTYVKVASPVGWGWYLQVS
jgi:hypothetical protein